LVSSGPGRRRRPRPAKGPCCIPDLAAELIRTGVDIFVVEGAADAGRVQQVTRTIPIVTLRAGDLVQSGLAASLARPGGNVTGITLISGEIGSKRIALFRDLLPGAKALGILLNSTTPASEAEAAAAERVAHTVGWRVTLSRVGRDLDFASAFRALEREGVDALLVTTDPVFESQRDRIVALAAQHAFPAMYALKEYAVAGGLMTYGASINDVYRQAGLYAGRILKGEKPADLPVMQASKFELVINLRTARTLGIQVPLTLLTTADEVIE